MNCLNKKKETAIPFANSPLYPLGAGRKGAASALLFYGVPCIILLFLFGIDFSSTAQIVINEVCANNGSIIQDEDNDEPDWLELYNTDSVGVSLSGYALSDSTSLKWFFPDVIIPSHGFLVVFASAKDRKGNFLHTSFRINKDGDILKLFNADGLLSDKLKITANQLDHSSGRKPDGNTLTEGIFMQPTPGTSNNSSGFYIGYCTNPILSSAAGFYKSTVFLSVDCGTSSHIFYTLDGSMPTNASSPSITLNLDTNTTFTACFNSLANSSGLTVFPNPVSAMLNAGFILNEETEGNFILVSADGRKVITTVKKQYTPGLVEFQTDISGFNAGVYIISFLSDNLTKSARVVIIH